MKAALFTGKHTIEMVEKAMPEIRDGEALIQMKACGVCGSEIPFYNGIPDYLCKHPWTIGHEMAGVVSQIKGSVTGLSIGDRVFIKLLSSESTIGLCNIIDSKIINNVYEYVAGNFHGKISFDVAASIANMQRSAFCRYFKRKTKKKFSEFVNETRIMHAKKLLAESDKTIMEIAFECGYENTSYFNRQFRLHCNITPTDFKEQISTVKYNDLINMEFLVMAN